MNSNNPVIVDDSQAIWTLTLNQPQKRNAMNLADRRALITALNKADADGSCRAVVLTGAGRVFCAGGDISAMTVSADEAAVRLGVLAELTTAFVRNRNPIIAAVEGGAFGLGLSLAAACDYVVAASDARFVASFGKLGLVADTGLHWTLSQRVGAARAKELILFRTELAAAEAHTLGLVDDLAAPGHAVVAAIKKADVFLDSSRVMVAMTKEIFAQRQFGLDQVLAAESRAQVSLLQTDEFRQRQKAFLDRSRRK